MDVWVELNEQVSRIQDAIIKKGRRDRREPDQRGMRMAGSENKV